jgi:hypothetical protein
MRPVARPAWSASWAQHPLIDSLYDQLGRFCAACERPLTAGAFLWQPSTGSLIGGRGRPGTWSDVLALCGECAAAAQGKPADASLLLPDRQLTFRLDASSPFRYERRTISVGGETVEAVIVVGTTDAARATIRHFALNTASYDDATDNLKLQDATSADESWPVTVDHLTLDAQVSLDYPDPRVYLRTRAWDHVTAYLPLLGHDDLAVRTAIEGQIRQMIYHSGFWSVWATVLWTAFQDVDQLTRLLLPPRRPTATGTLAATVGATGGTARDFPNTRADWLPARPTAEEPG